MEITRLFIGTYEVTLRTFFNCISSWVNNKPRERERLTPSHSGFSTRLLAGILGAVLILTTALLLLGCPELTTYTCQSGNPIGGRTTSSNAERCQSTNYTCSNGIPVKGKTTARVTEQCQSCNDGFKLSAAKTCVKYAYVCEHGTPSGEDATADNITRCAQCNRGYNLVNSTCVPIKYVCENGTPANGFATDVITRCTRCNSGYTMVDQRCALDSDGDGVANLIDSCALGKNEWTSTSITDSDRDGCRDSDEDVDDDNDGLIEIFDLTMLHNMRYNLAGTGYDDEALDTGGGDATGDNRGGPTRINANCTNAVHGIYLCGYELTQELTFDKDGDGKTFEADGSGSFTLDNDDNNATYFPVANDGSGGWLPIGDNTNPFTAIFEGNGHTIRHMAISRDQTYIGMFGYTDTGAHIRNIGLVNSLADYSGSTGGVRIGGLVALQRNSSISASYADVTADGADSVGGLVGYFERDSIITASYATGSVHGGGGNDIVGGLVGSKEVGTIIASYATSAVHGGDGIDRVGGLVGFQNINSDNIIASYATGAVDGGGGNNDLVGGLVGWSAGGTITASYATGTVHGGAGNDYVGGLQGYQSLGNSIIASYATGSVDGGLGTDTVGKVIGARDGGFHSTSYGFGTTYNVDAAGIDGTAPVGVPNATGLTASNTVIAACVGIVNLNAYTTSGTCTATSKIACTWSGGTCSGSVNGIDCTVFGSSSSCRATTKTAGDWVTNVWNAAAAGTAGAWDFGTSSQAPALRYADFDGSGSNYNCNQFPTGKCNTLIPGQR